MALAVVTDFGETGYTDPLVKALSFGPEKVLAEAAMLAYAASGLTGRTAVSTRIERLAARLAPLVRSQRALAEMALQPARSFKYAVPHVLLNQLGHNDPRTDRYFRARCSQALALWSDLPPSAMLEREWIARLWGLDAGAVGATQEQHFGRPLDILSESREDAYAFTHQLFYLTDFGRKPQVRLARPLDDLLADVEALLLRYLDAEDYDLAGELLMSWAELRADWSPTAAFAFRVLARVEDEVGVLPCGNADVTRMASLNEAEGTRYARATGYHTAFVMGFLCAAILRSEALPTVDIGGPESPRGTWQTLRDLIDDTQGHWLQDFERSTDVEKRALAGALANLAILQRIRLGDYAGVHRLLTLADDASLPPHPVRRVAVHRLHAVAQAMDAATRPA